MAYARRRVAHHLSWVSTIFQLARRHSSSVDALAHHRPEIPQVHRISARDFVPDIHYRHDATHEFPETPVLVQGVIDVSECETMCDTLMTARESTIVTMQQTYKHGHATNMELHDCTLTQGIHAIMDSHHNDSRFIFQEGLLEQQQQDNQNGLDLLSKRLYAAQEALFPDDEDWLQYFPPNLKPSSCVVIAGEGATSTLHRDPLEWTGTSTCLEGTKMWRFLAPSPNVQTVDETLQYYRLESIAWEDQDASISAGWQSDYNLYDKRSDDVPSAQALDEFDLTQKYKVMETIASDITKLEPNLPLDYDTKIYTVIQKPGDLLIIPAHWWHQTYALEPSIAIASQRCGTIRDAPRLLSHILETTRLGNAVNMYNRLYKDSFEDVAETPEQIVSRLFHEISPSLMSQ